MPWSDLKAVANEPGGVTDSLACFPYPDQTATLLEGIASGQLTDRRHYWVAPPLSPADMIEACHDAWRAIEEGQRQSSRQPPRGNP
jgi:hypothetical protein